MAAKFFVAVGKYLQHSDFNNPVLANVNAGSFQVENN
jgi:hypothetical protein